MLFQIFFWTSLKSWKYRLPTIVSIRIWVVRILVYTILVSTSQQLCVVDAFSFIPSPMILRNGSWGVHTLGMFTELVFLSVISIGVAVYCGQAGYLAAILAIQSQILLDTSSPFQGLYFDTPAIRWDICGLTHSGTRFWFQSLYQCITIGGWSIIHYGAVHSVNRSKHYYILLLHQAFPSWNIFGHNMIRCCWKVLLI